MPDFESKTIGDLYKYDKKHLKCGLKFPLKQIYKALKKLDRKYRGYIVVKKSNAVIKDPEV